MNKHEKFNTPIDNNDRKPMEKDARKFNLDGLNASGLLNEKGILRLRQLSDQMAGDDFRFIRDLKRKFGKGIDICLVGGIVRDAILDKNAKDYDFVVSFANSGFKSHEEARKAFEDFFSAREDIRKSIPHLLTCNI